MAQPFAKKLYASKAWTELRFNLIIERGPICQRCNSLVHDTSKLIGHHKKLLTKDNIDNIYITLNKDNIELICSTCHNREPHHFMAKNSREVYIIYGSPMSGKTTLVNHMSSPGDMILDLDKIYEAISGQPIYDKPNNLRFNVFAIRDKMLDMIKTRYGQWHNAYVVGGYPNKHERERLARELGAELIYCESTQQECYARVNGRDGKSSEWHKWIDKWWMEYVE